MSKDIYFKDLPELTQACILDQYGVDTPAELGLDKEPYMTIHSDEFGLAAIGIKKIKTA